MAKATTGLTETRPSLAYDGYNEVAYKLVTKGQRVLDVGCATGRLGEKLSLEKGCYVVGLEIDPPSAEIARKRCAEVIVGDIEELDDLPFPDGFFDVIVFADSLEHMRDPLEVLKKTKRLLSNEGCLIASIPNVALIITRMSLLLGRFDYADYGVLDRNHLRFFTFKTARVLLQVAGYNVVFSTGYSAVRSRYYFSKPLAKIWKTLFAPGFVMKATKMEIT
jgi:methionine biosynthesis protein MetW